MLANPFDQAVTVGDDRLSANGSRCVAQHEDEVDVMIPLLARPAVDVDDDIDAIGVQGKLAA
jgi:hypothetical protein